MSRSLRNLTLRVSLRVERADRFIINADAQLASRAVSQHNVPVVNLSMSGCLVISNLALPIDTSVLVTIPGIGMHAAVVRRVKGLEHGVQFRLPLSARDIEDIRLEYPSALIAADGSADKHIPPPGARGLIGSLFAAFGK